MVKNVQSLECRSILEQEDLLTSDGFLASGKNRREAGKIAFAFSYLSSSSLRLRVELRAFDWCSDALIFVREADAVQHGHLTALLRAVSNDELLRKKKVLAQVRWKPDQ